MKRFTILSLTAILSVSLISSPPAAAQAASIPPPVVHKDVDAKPGHLPKVHYVSGQTVSPHPAWIEKSMLLNPDESVNMDLASPAVAAALKALQSSPVEGGCVRVRAYPEDSIGVPPRGTIEEGTRNSSLIVRGKVTEKSFGFRIDIPGQLLRVVPQETLKGTPREVSAYFVFLPVGNFHLGSTPLCKMDDRYADAPRVGDEVLLFVPAGFDRDQDVQEPLLELEDGEGLVTIRSKDDLSLPRTWRNQIDVKSSPLTLDEILSRIRSAMGSQATLENSESLPEEDLNLKATDPCVTSLSTNPLFGPSAWQLVPDSSVPAGIVAPAMAAWDNASCNSGGTSFPPFMTSAVSGARPVPVSYVQGTNPDRNGSCGHTSPAGITLYSTASKPGGGTVNCGNTSILIQNLEHELGHQLDLADTTNSNCVGYIMSQLAFPPQTGSTPPQPIPRFIHQSECAEAGHDNITPAEQAPPPPPPVVCPPECPTSCLADGTCGGGGGPGVDGDCEDWPWEIDCGPVLNRVPQNPKRNPSD
jgi:hypothetical protein